MEDRKMAAGCPLEHAPLPRKAKIFIAKVIALQILDVFIKTRINTMKHYNTLIRLSRYTKKRTI